MRLGIEHICSKSVLEVVEEVIFYSKLGTGLNIELFDLATENAAHYW